VHVASWGEVHLSEGNTCRRIKSRGRRNGAAWCSGVCADGDRGKRGALARVCNGMRRGVPRNAPSYHQGDGVSRGQGEQDDAHKAIEAMNVTAPIPRTARSLKSSSNAPEMAATQPLENCERR
jgi:hypothetical protein